MAAKANFTVVLVSHLWNRTTRTNDKLRITVKAENLTKDAGLAMVRTMQAKIKNVRSWSGPDYRVVGPRQLKALQDQVKEQQAKNRKLGQKRAAEERKATGAKKRFILCPRCQSKSKLLFSEMGGLQTRRCTNGHTFEFDKWIADRAFWGPIMGAGIPDPYVRK